MTNEQTQDISEILAQLIDTKSLLEKSIATYNQDIEALKRIAQYDSITRQYVAAVVVRIKRYIREDEIDLKDVRLQLEKLQKPLL